MSDTMYEVFVGIDWASEAHQVCVLNARGQVESERSVPGSGTDLAEFMLWLLTLCHNDASQVAVAIEVPHGGLVETLLLRGFHVYALNPKQLDRFRDRFFPAGSKDDRRDAFVLGHSLLTDRHCFRRLQVEEPLLIRMRELSRLDDELRLSFQRVANQLRDQLIRYFPQWLPLAPSGDEPWMWTLLEAAPTPQRAGQLTLARVEEILRYHRIRRLAAADVLARLQAPGFQLVAGTADAVSEHVLLLLPHLQLLHRQRADLRRRLEELLQQMIDTASDAGQGQPGDVAVLLSLHGVGRTVAATLLAEASQALAARDYHALRAHGGIAPITRQSGRKKSVGMRYACNGRLRNAFYHWARVSMQHEPRSRQHYQQLRHRGHSHGRALRGVADRLLAVLCAMLRTHTLYDPARRLS